MQHFFLQHFVMSTCPHSYSLIHVNDCGCLTQPLATRIWRIISQYSHWEDTMKHSVSSSLGISEMIGNGHRARSCLSAQPVRGGWRKMGPLLPISSWGWSPKAPVRSRKPLHSGDPAWEWWGGSSAIYSARKCVSCMYLYSSFFQCIHSSQFTTVFQYQ